MNGLNIVFAGTPEFGIPCLESLFHSLHQIKAVYTQPDRPAGRGRHLQASAVKEWANAHNIPVYQPLNFKSQDAIDALNALKPDLLIVIAYGLILPQAVLDIPKLGCINVHASLLPKWRGAAPIQYSILKGDTQTGVTIMQMDKGMDTGAMLALEQCPITESDTAGSLHDKLAQISAPALLCCLQNLATISPQAQDNSLATYAHKITKENARINWQQSAKEIHCLIRAFNPWPIAYTHAGTENVRIYSAIITQEKSNQTPGTVLKLDKHGMLVATGDYALLVESIQFPGGKVIAIADWINAGKDQLRAGLILQ